MHWDRGLGRANEWLIVTQQPLQLSLALELLLLLLVPVNFAADDVFSLFLLTLLIIVVVV